MTPSANRSMRAALAVCVLGWASTALAATPAHPVKPAHPVVRLAKARALRRPRLLNTRIHTVPSVAAHTDQTARDRFADEGDKGGLVRGTVHYEHGPSGLSDDVTTFGVAKHF